MLLTLLLTLVTMACIPTAALAVPSSVHGTWVVPGNGQVVLQWEPTAGATQYRVYESTAEGTTGPRVATVPAPDVSVTLTGRTNGTKYWYTVRAFDETGESTDPTFSIPTPTSQNAWFGTPDDYNHWASCMSLVRGKIYMFGGFNGMVSAVNNKIYSYDPLAAVEANTGYTLPTMYGCASSTWHGKAYIFGGSSGGPDGGGGTYYTAVREFTPGVGVVVKSAVLPVGVTMNAAVTLNDHIYIFGGRTACGTEINTIYDYNPATDTMATLGAVLGSAQAQVTATTWNGNAWIFPGLNIGCFVGIITGRTAFNTPYQLALPATVTAKTVTPTAVSGAGAVGFNDMIWISGGAANTPGGAGGSSQIYRVDPRSGSGAYQNEGYSGLPYLCAWTTQQVRGHVELDGGMDFFNGFIYSGFSRFFPKGQMRGTPNPTAAAPPTGLTATGGANKVTLNWTAPGGSFHQYRIFRSAYPGEQGDLIEEEVGLVDPPTVSLVDNNLGACTKYYYTMTAVDWADIETAPLATVNATTTCPSGNATPPSPASLGQNDASGAAITTGGWTHDGVTTGVQLTGQVQDPDAGQTLTPWVEVQPIGTPFSGTCGVASSTVLRGLPVTAAAAGTPVAAKVVVTDLVAPGAYHWRMCVIDQNQAGSGWTTIGGTPDFNIDITPPPTPSPIRDGIATDIATQNSTSSFSANWDAVVDADSGIQKYKYCLGTTSGGCEVVAWADGTATPSISALATLSVGPTYYVSVRAVDRAGNTSGVGTSNGFQVVVSAIPIDLLTEGAAQPTNVSTTTPRFSWIGRSGSNMDRQRVQVVTDPLDNVSALWHFDTATGATTDASGNGNSIVYTGSTSVGGQTGFSEARNFSVGGSVGTAPAAAAPSSATWTVEAWFRTNDTSSIMTLVNKGNGTTNSQFAITWDNVSGGCNVSGCFNVEMSTTDTVQHFTNGTTTTQLRDGNWHYVAAVNTGTALQLFVDGQLIDTRGFAGTPSSPVASVEIGNHAASQWKGDIDDVRISTVARSASEISGYFATRMPHNAAIWDSDVTDAGVALSAVCTTGTRCADILYGGTPALIHDGARYYVRGKFKTTGNTWSGYSDWDWFATQTSITVSILGGPTQALSPAVLLPNTDATAKSDVQVTTNDARGYQLMVTGPSDAVGMSGPGALPLWTGLPGAPTTWAAGVAGGFGLSLLSCPGGKSTATWGTGVAETDVSNLKYVGPKLSSSTLLYQRSGYSPATDTIQTAYRADVSTGVTAGAYSTTLAYTVIPNV